MTHPLLKEAVSKLLHERADKDGMIVGLPVSEMAEITGGSQQRTAAVVNLLIADGELTRMVDGLGTRCAVYRLGGTAALRLPRPPPKDTSHGIETVIRMMRRDTWTGNIVEIPVSLPRLRCLERPL